MIMRILISMVVLLLPLTGLDSLNVCAAKADSAWPPPQEVISLDAIPGEKQSAPIPAGPDTTPLPIPPPEQETGQPQPPDDPCLPSLYKDWREFSQGSRSGDGENGFERLRIIISRSDFTLVLEGIRRDESFEELYRTPVALGDIDSPTPEGQFLINHIYCYPDVAYFPANSDPVTGLYNGFFAPLLLCDEDGRCERFQDLGIHGFHGSALPNHAATRIDTYGAVSAGCIRLPHPCKFKSALLRAVGLRPLKKNDRGTYHWLNRPVQVLITGNYPGTEDPTTVASIVEQGLLRLNDGLKSIWGAFQ